jgi:hypothetical protein
MINNILRIHALLAQSLVVWYVAIIPKLSSAGVPSSSRVPISPRGTYKYICTKATARGCIYTCARTERAVAVFNGKHVGAIYLCNERAVAVSKGELYTCATSGPWLSRKMSYIPVQRAGRGCLERRAIYLCNERAVAVSKGELCTCATSRPWLSPMSSM